MCSDSINSFISTAPIIPAIWFLVHRILALNNYIVQILLYFKRDQIITANLIVWCTELSNFTVIHLNRVHFNVISQVIDAHESNVLCNPPIPTR